MIKDVPLIGVFVNDQEAALDFYTNKLRLEKIQDAPYGENVRWITVSPRGTRIRIVLKKAEHDHEKAMVGRSDGAPVLTLGTDDVRAAYEELRKVAMYGFHYSLGMGWGPTYAFLRRWTGLNPVSAGLLSGAAMSFVVDEGMTPLLGFSAPNRAYPLSTHLSFRFY